MKRGKFMAILVAMMVALAPSAAFADELMDLMELEELLFTEIAEVESVGFFKVKKTKAPGYSTVIAAQTIENSSARTLADVLEAFAPGVSINRHEAYGPLIGMRGVAIDNNAKTLVMLDGQQLNSRMGAGYSNEYDLPLLGDIAKIEVINGPGAIVHGSGAISGFINMVPKNGSDFPGFTAEVEHGFVDQSYSAELGYGKSFGEGHDLYLYGGFINANGVRNTNRWDYGQYYATRDGWSGDAVPAMHEAGFRAKGYSDPSYKFGAYYNKGNLNVNAFFTEIHSYYGSAQPYQDIWDAAAAAKMYFKEEAYHTMKMGIRPKYTFKLSDVESIDVISGLTLMHQYRDGNTADYDPGNNVSNHEEGGKEYNADLKVVAKTERIDKLHLAVGGQMGRRQFEQGEKWYNGSHDDGYYLESETATWHEYAAFTEAVVDVTDKLAVSAGVRYDQVSYSPIKSLASTNMPDSQDNTSHRLAAAYEVNEDTAVKLSYSEGFRTPDVTYYEEHGVMWNPSLQNAGLPLMANLDIEEMSSTEFNFSTKLPDLKLGLDFNAYYNEYSKTLHWHNYDMRTNVSDAQADAVIADYGWFEGMANAPGKFRSLGYEVVVDWKPTSKMDIKLIYGYSAPYATDPNVKASMYLVDDAKGSWIRYPTHSIKLNTTSYWLNDKLMLYLGYQYQNGTSGKVPNNKVHWIYHQSRHIVDLAIDYKFTDSLSAKLTVKNAFDHNVPRMTYYGEPNSGAFGEERAYVYLSTKYEF